jgi:predicted double-glycine peptidase
MHIIIAFAIAMSLFASFHTPRQIPDNEFQMNMGVSSSAIGTPTSPAVSSSVSPIIVKQNVIPLKEFQDRHVIKQNYDYSCGSAAFATLLNYYVGENLTERQVILGLMEYGDKYKIAERKAFSLLDMKKFANKLGYEAAGYKAELQDVLELKKPCIIPIEFFGYRHFTVLRGFHNGHVFLADPFRGNTSYTISEFQKMWYENVIFVVEVQGSPPVNALKLNNEDLRKIDEDDIDEMIADYGPYFPPIDERNFDSTLPDDYQKYHR